MSTLSLPLAASATATGLLAATPAELIPIAVTAAGASMFILLSLMLVKSLRHICRPNEALIFTGRKHKNGPRVILGRGHRDQGESGGGMGGAWKLPFVERVDALDMRSHSIDIMVQNAYSAGNIPLKIHAIANVKIHSDPTLIRNAIERFLHQSSDEVRKVARQTLEGALRDVLAQMTPEQVNEDRLTFAEHLGRSARDDLDKLGLQLDTLKIQNVSDDTGYLDSLGRPQIAAALRDAENAENLVRQEIAEAQARANQTASVAKAEAEKTVVQKRNQLQQLEAELGGEADAIEREAVAAAQTARAVAEQELQEVRRELEQKRLIADVVLPAQARKRAAELKAKGDAAPTVEDGAAVAAVLERTSEAWREMGPQARELYVIQHLEEIVGSVAKSVEKLDVREVNVLDSGDGSGLSGYAASYPKAVAAILSSLRETTGVDIPALLAGEPSDSSPPRPATTIPATATRS